MIKTSVCSEVASCAAIGQFFCSGTGLCCVKPRRRHPCCDTAGSGRNSVLNTDVYIHAKKAALTFIQLEKKSRVGAAVK